MNVFQSVSDLCECLGYCVIVFESVRVFCESVGVFYVCV